MLVQKIGNLIAINGTVSCRFPLTSNIFYGETTIGERWEQGFGLKVQGTTAGMTFTDVIPFASRKELKKAIDQLDKIMEDLAEPETRF